MFSGLGSEELQGEAGVGDEGPTLLADCLTDGPAFLDSLGGALGASEDLHESLHAGDPAGLEL